MSWGSPDEVEGTETFADKRPLCGFCNAPWSDGMVKIFQEVGMDGYESSGYYASGTASVEVTCSTCKKLIYKKEGRPV